MEVRSIFAIVFTIFLFYAPMTKTAITESFMFNKLENQDVVFTNYTMFYTTDRSSYGCANQCSSRDGCLAFTFTEGGSNPGECRGYSTSFNATDSSVMDQPGATTYQMDPCGHINYTVLDDFRRHVNESIRYYENDLSSYRCYGTWRETDSDCRLTPGWYRFMLNGTNAVMATDCVQRYQCSACFPVWLDLQNRTLPAVGKEKKTRRCLNANDNECSCIWEDTATIRNCGTHFLYKLQPTPICSAINCIEI